MMDQQSFSNMIASIKSMEDNDLFDRAQDAYRALAHNELDQNQHATVLIGSASCSLRAYDPSSAHRVLADLNVDTLDSTVQAIVHNLRANIFHEFGDYKQACIEAKIAENIAVAVGEADLDVLGEALGRQGFAEAELGRLQAAKDHLARALKLPVDEALMKSISLYRTQYGL